MPGSELPDTAQWSTRRLRLRAGWALVRHRVGKRMGRRERLARRAREAFYDALWRQAATEVGLPVHDLDNGELEVVLDDRRLRISGADCSVDDRGAAARAGDKEMVYRLLAEHGLPVPEHRVFTLADPGSARAFVAAAPGRFVVKPARDGAGGRGVTTGVRTDRDLAAAAVAAAAAGARGGYGGALARCARAVAGLLDVPLLVERQSVGREYRLLYLDGRLVDALRREQPTVTGDGHRTIAELLAAANADRLRRGSAQGVIGRSLELVSTLAAQGLELSSVPPAGAVVRAKSAINENAPENNFPARAELCDAVVAQGARAAELVGVRLAGIDVITPDPSAELGMAGGVLLEVNTPPGLAIHYGGHPGGARPATEVLRRLGASRLGASRLGQPQRA